MGYKGTMKNITKSKTPVDVRRAIKSANKALEGIAGDLLSIDPAAFEDPEIYAAARRAWHELQYRMDVLNAARPRTKTERAEAASEAAAG